MEVSRVVFLLFLIIAVVESRTQQYLRRLAINAEDLFEVVQESTAGFPEFRDKLEVAYKNVKFELYPKTGKIDWSKLDKNLNAMIDSFVLQSGNYVRRYLSEYFELAVLLIDKNDDKYSNGDVRRVLRFPEDDCVYCVFAAIHDIDQHGEMLFEGVFYLRTLDLVLDYSLGGLKMVFSRYHTRFEHISYAELSEKTHLDGIIKRLDEVKRVIIEFSKAFCRLWTPLVSHDSLAKPVSEEVRNQSRFVRHFFLDEKCTIIPKGPIFKKRVIVAWWADYPLYNTDWIISWDCSNILKSQEYGFQEYEESVNPKKDEERELSDDVVGGSERSEPVVKNQFSLSELKDVLQSENYFENVLEYYNIVWDVMLFASISEGDKSIKGIKLVVRHSCSGTNDEEATVGTIRGLRATLYAFKSVFEEFVGVMRDEKRIIVEWNPEKKVFEERVDRLLRLLDVRDDVTAGQSCGEILKELEDTNVDGRAYPVGDPIGVTKFRGYYFYGPLLHVQELHHFTANGLKFGEAVIVPDLPSDEFHFVLSPTTTE